MDLTWPVRSCLHWPWHNCESPESTLLAQAISRQKADVMQVIPGIEDLGQSVRRGKLQPLHQKLPRQLLHLAAPGTLQLALALAVLLTNLHGATYMWPHLM